ncbi:SWR1-complex protein 5 [Fulvia fulva]|uniref:SWR1-complex protein 5 n=1 Tax=Passalora fulva TaxID=5499 RepID=A0A9Q8P5Q0_PASFU|nr:SWR1-complex protein 5 [Fulvia fulva]KAK4631244.1 SWR1-complex protein 5 [Fulvia fulva]KAK4633010.1 SWR1-complex protein 5 [Fulvia fulva]UJO13982.1 SWR1-complex protein 5 [Fulvia fulva]WPV10843.1 SWR1-complex protein 5 [Fulvia fulva]WPV25520.1 SWR1-complex protein 5 [Fulvia fulva]
MARERYVSKVVEPEPEPPEEEVEEYNENEDEDFAPEEADDDENVSSSSEDEENTAATKPAPKKSGKRKTADVDGDLDSGDEATIKERKRKKRRKDAGANDEDSGGEGGLVRTRAQRVVEKEERKNRKRARDGEVTIDVNALWADLSSMPIGRTTITPPKPEDDAMDIDDEENNKENAPISSEDMITIKRRIEYAGEVTIVTDTVPRSSKEAKQYLAEHPELDPSNPTPADSTGLLKPLKRPSMFEPNPIGLVKGVAPEKLRLKAPTRLDVLMAEKRAEEKKKKAQKMSTVQKSQLDWKGFVDQEGLRDELDEYGKSRRGFLAREAFLDRAAGAREQAARDARLKL